jgi:hypothetical protein
MDAMNTISRLSMVVVGVIVLNGLAQAQGAPPVPPLAPVPAVMPVPPVMSVPPVMPTPPVMPVFPDAFAAAHADMSLGFVALGTATDDLALALAEAQAAAQGTAQAQETEKARAAREAAAAKRDEEREHARTQQRAARAQSEQERLLEHYYARGTAALDSGRWSQALEAFAKAAEQQGSRADGALYWKAYVEYKLAETAAALATLKNLQGTYPDSRWLKEAQALELEMAGARGAAASAGANPDDELKLLAINSLIASDSEQAIPLLEKILTGTHSPQLKKRALFVLAQSKSPRAKDLLLTVAKGSGNPDLQLDALQYLGMFGGAQNLQALGQIYAGSKDADVRRRILQTYMMAGQTDLILQAARTETTPALRSQAVRLLGAMRASAELDVLYQAESSPEVKRAIVEAYMMGGNADRLAALAKSERDPALRLRAIEMLGAMGKGKGGAVLPELYWTEGQTKDVRRAVINGLFIAGNATAIIDIARKETDQDLRKAAVERLSLMKSKEATDFLMELLNK